MCSWPLNNKGLKCMGLLIREVFQQMYSWSPASPGFAFTNSYNQIWKTVQCFQFLGVCGYRGQTVCIIYIIVYEKLEHP